MARFGQELVVLEEVEFCDLRCDCEGPMVRVTRGTMVNCCLCSSLKEEKGEDTETWSPWQICTEMHGQGFPRVQGVDRCWVDAPERRARAYAYAYAPERRPRAYAYAYAPERRS